MKFFSRHAQPTPPPAQQPRVPSAPRTASNGSRGRPSSHRSVGSGGRISTSPQASTPEPDADIGEEDCAAFSGDEAVLDCGWGIAPAAPIGEDPNSKLRAVLAAAENRVRALEKQIQSERRLRKDAEDFLAHTRSKLTTPVQTSSRDTSSTLDEDLLRDAGVQTDKQPEPVRQDIEREIEAAVATLQTRNDVLEIENSMFIAEVAAKDAEIKTLKSDNTVLWAEQESVRAAKDDFKDLQEQLAGHIKAGNLITKRPSSSANRVYANPVHHNDDANAGLFGGLRGSAEVAEVRGGLSSYANSRSSPSSPRSPMRQIENNTPTPSPVRIHEHLHEKQPESALSNFLDIFGNSQGCMHYKRKPFEEIQTACRDEPNHDPAQPMSADPLTSDRSGAAPRTKPTVAEYRRSVSVLCISLSRVFTKIPPRLMHHLYHSNNFGVDDYFQLQFEITIVIVFHYC